MATRSDCSVVGCDGVASTRGYCRRHYVQWTRTGDPLTARERRDRGTGANLAIVRDDERSHNAAIGSHLAAVEESIAGLADVDPARLEQWNAASLHRARTLAAQLDAVQSVDAGFKLGPQYLAALREAGLTGGARKPVAKQEEQPLLRDVSAY